MSDQQGTDERALEQALISRSQRGDKGAFNRLVERHQTGAYALALRMLGNPENAADVTQDAFFSAYRAIGSFHGASFRAWLYRIVGNGCIDYWRSQRRRPSASLEATLADAHDPDTSAANNDARLPSSLIDPSWDPERAILRSEVIAQIQAALLRLPEEQRLAVILSDVQGLPYEEIARIMESSLGTVKSRISRARARLRDEITRSPELFGRLSRREGE